MSLIDILKDTLNKLTTIAQQQAAPSLKELILKHSAEFNIDPKLVACIIEQESGGEEEAYRFEDNFYDNLLKNKTRNELAGFVPKFIPTLASEKRARATSWGAMQIMGDTLRVLGFSEKWLPKGRKNEVNIYYGCKYLRKLFDRFSKIILDDPDRLLRQVLRTWNGSADYPPIILQHLKNEVWKKYLGEIV